MGALKTVMKVGAGVGLAFGARKALDEAREEDLHGEVALVTGGSSGLGLQMARELADEGARLVICARGEDELQRAGEDLEARGAEVLAIQCDVGNREDVRHMIATAVEQFGSIDLLICNAGVIQVGQFQSMEAEDFHEALDIMFFGALYPILEVLPHMRERGEGRIALVTSIGGKISVPYLLPYNSAKFAAVGLGEGLRAELQDEGITVTTIVPGLMRTGSYVNAEFSGEPDGRESTYRVFSALSSLPLLTTSGEDAAKAFIGAIKRGDAQIIYPPQYSLLARVHGVAPAVTMAAMSVADRLLPDTGDHQGQVLGEAIDDQQPDEGVWRLLTTLGRKAARAMQPRSEKANA
jgi:NAD(P)-dependent dehydrogenase (short-subunit alcohol dehydrogenase family)